MAQIGCYFALRLLLLTAVVLVDTTATTTANDRKFSGNPSLLRQRERYLRYNAEQTPTVIGHGETKLDSSIKERELIIGGVNAGWGNYPYFVHWPGAGCGGTLIHEDIILSAAHCYYDYLKNNNLNEGSKIVDSDFSRVFIGASYLGSGKSRTILDIFPHPDYDTTTHENDFLVLRIDRPVQDVRPIQLNSDGEFPPLGGSPLTVIGLGMGDAQISNGIMRLQEVNVSNIERDECVNRLMEYKTSSSYSCADENTCDFMSDTVTLCTEALGYNAGGDIIRGACQGDSGGPLLDAESGIQVGTVSWGFGCGDGAPPGVYGRVSGAFDWIQETVCSKSTHPPPWYCVTVNIAIASDNYPHENYFTLFERNEQDKDNIFEHNNENKDNAAHDVVLYQSELEVEPLGTLSLSFGLRAPGTYALALTDIFGDGMCCNFGQGRVVISLDDNNGDNGDNDSMTKKNPDPKILHDTVAKFDSLLMLDFDLTPTAPSPFQGNNTLSSSDNAMHVLQIEIQYDAFPWETAWGLYHIDDTEQQNLIHWSHYGMVLIPNKLESVQIDDLSDGSYVFSILDSSNNGMLKQPTNNTAEPFLWSINEIVVNDAGNTTVHTIHVSRENFKWNDHYAFILSKSNSYLYT